VGVALSVLARAAGHAGAQIESHTAQSEILAGNWFESGLNLSHPLMAWLCQFSPELLAMSARKLDRTLTEFEHMSPEDSAKEVGHDDDDEEEEEEEEESGHNDDCSREPSVTNTCQDCRLAARLGPRPDSAKPLSTRLLAPFLSPSCHDPIPPSPVLSRRVLMLSPPSLPPPFAPFCPLFLL
jgi:hypothetical protein